MCLKWSIVSRLASLFFCNGKNTGGDDSASYIINVFQPFLFCKRGHFKVLFPELFVFSTNEDPNFWLPFSREMQGMVAIPFCQPLHPFDSFWHPPSPISSSTLEAEKTHPFDSQTMQSTKHEICVPFKSSWDGC